MAAKNITKRNRTVTSFVQLRTIVFGAKTYFFIYVIDQIRSTFILFDKIQDGRH